MRPEIIPVGVGAALFAGAAAASPLVAAGAVLGAALFAAIYVMPGIGLALMVLTGTTLQVLGSEHISGLPVSLGKVAGAVTLAAWLARNVVRRLPATWSPQMLALLAFLAAVLLAALMTPVAEDRFEGLVRYAQLVLLTVMIANIAGESERALNQACIALTVCLTLSCLIGLAEFLLPSLSIESDDPSLVQGSIGAVIDRDSLEGVEIKRITGGLSDSNWFSYTLVAVLPVNLYLYVRFAGPIARLAILSMATLQITCTVLSFTRSALIALAISVLYLMMRNRLPRKLLLLAGLLAIGFVLWNPAGLSRIFSAQYAQEGSTPMRTYLVLGGIHLVQVRPITGFGYNQYGPHFMDWLDQQHDVPESVLQWQDATERRVATGEERLEWIMPHNTILQIWVEFGLFGLLAFGGILVFMLTDLSQARRFGDPSLQLLADCLVAATLGFLVCAMFGHLALAKMVWLLAGFAAATRRVAIDAAAATRAVDPAVSR